MKIQVKLKSILSIILTLFIAVPAMPILAQAAEPDVFFDDFEGETLDASKWVIAHKTWGGTNGGVVSQNVSVSDGTLKLEGHGNYYTGDVPGINRPDGTRTGAAIATRDYYASGSYEVKAKVAPVYGACSAIWTFEYEEYYPGDPEYIASGATGQYTTVNHEIDIEMPTANEDFKEPSFQAARFNTWRRENRHNDSFETLPTPQNDGNWHIYRFDWHTQTDNPHVDFYVDGQLLYTSYEQIPTKAGRFWLGLWFPSGKDTDHDGYGDSGWTGTANFDTAVFEIDYAKITPYHEGGDEPENESFKYDGFVKNSFPELAEAEHFNHINETAWKASGSAQLKEGYAELASGKDTDSISQKIKVLKNLTYTLKADVITSGAEITVGVRDHNGRYSNAHVSTTKSGTLELQFTTAAHVTECEIYAQVVRYQSNSSPCQVSNVRVYAGDGADIAEITKPETPQEPGTELPDPNMPDQPDPSKPDVPDINEPEQPDPDQPNDPDQPREPDTTDPNVPDPSIPDQSDPTIPNIPDQPAPAINLIDVTAWTLTAKTFENDGIYTLRSSSSTDTMYQKIKVEKGASYRLAANVTTSGADFTLGVRDYNGRYTNLHKTVSENGQIVIDFTTASHISQIEIYAEVLRYQSNTSPCTISNIQLVKVD